VVQVAAFGCSGQGEGCAIGEEFGPQELVVAAQGWAVGVRVFAGRGVDADVEGGVDQAAQSGHEANLASRRRGCGSRFSCCARSAAVNRSNSVRLM